LENDTVLCSSRFFFFFSRVEKGARGKRNTRIRKKKGRSERERGRGREREEREERGRGRVEREKGVMRRQTHRHADRQR
jgi:hypothetical protein